MEPSDVRKEIKRLVDLIRYHNACYFQKGISKISDYAYDQLLERLVQLEQAYPHLKYPDSPTEGIGERPSKGFVVVYHQTPMLSLAKTYSEKEVEQFIERVKKMVPDSTMDFVCEPKIDGVALSLLYERGHLIRVVTRGDGQKGDDVTHHATQCLNLPYTIQGAPSVAFEVRGEAFMSKAVFAALNNERKAKGEPLWANPRNLTAGTLKTLDVALVKGRQLAFHGYSFYASSYDCPTQEAALMLLDSLGFSTTYKLCHNVSDIMEYIHYWAQHKKDFPVDVDGIVIKVNNLHQQRMIGMTSKSPRWAIAYKYQPEMAHSILERVTFQVGRTGAVTPVAHFSPITLAGTIVRRASLHNADELARRDLYLGDKIFIEKGGEIIPKVVGVDSALRNQASKPVAFIGSCPACGTPLYRAPEAVVYYCPNKQQCLPQLKGSLLHFAHRKAMDIHTLGPKTVDALLEAKLVYTVADLYTLRYEAVNRLAGFQALSTQKLLANIQASKTKPFDSLLFALGIQYVGETVAKQLAFHFRCMERLQRASEAELLQLPAIGQKIGQSLLAYFQDPYQQAILRGLQRAGLQFSLPEPADTLSVLDCSRNSTSQNSVPQIAFESGLLASKKIVISGTFQKFTREELIKLIEQAGGRVVSAISTKVDYLVAGTKAGPSKLEKAVQWAIPILEENDLIKMMQ